MTKAAEEKAAKAAKAAEEKAAKAALGSAESLEDTAREEGQVDVVRSFKRPDGKVSSRHYVRTYSEKDHGEGFFELATEFTTKPEYAGRNYELVPSSSVTAVEVLYREDEHFEENEKARREKGADATLKAGRIVDKRKVFTDKAAAVAFNNDKKGSMLAVSE